MLYTSAAYAALAEESQVTLSVGRTGQRWDNALAESFSSLKGELIDSRAWPTRAGARRCRTLINAALDAGVPLRDVQEAASLESSDWSVGRDARGPIRRRHSGR